MESVSDTESSQSEKPKRLQKRNSMNNLETLGTNKNVPHRFSIVDLAQNNNMKGSIFKSYRNSLDGGNLQSDKSEVSKPK